MSKKIEDNPFFSVIVPIYNKEKTITRSILSILNQDFYNYEIIAVCDPSSDNSLEKLQDIHDVRIRIFHRDTPGPGGYAARNLGLKMARGKFITFLDADDEWLNDRLSSHYHLIIKFGVDLVFSSWREVYPDGKVSKPITLEEKTISNKEFFKRYSSAPRLLHTNTITVKKSIFESVGGFPEGEYKRGGDVYTWLKVIFHTNNIYFSTKEVAIYHKEDSTVTKNHRPDITNNAVRDMCLSIISKSFFDFNNNFYLLRISNRHIRYGLVDRIKEGEFEFKSLKNYHFLANPLEFLKLLFAGLVSKLISRDRFNNILNHIKK